MSQTSERRWIVGRVERRHDSAAWAQRFLLGSTDPAFLKHHHRRVELLKPADVELSAQNPLPQVSQHFLELIVIVAQVLGLAYRKQAVQ